MSEIALFGVGSLLFIAVTWATVAFGVHRVHELQTEEVERSDRTVVELPGGLTEIHSDDVPTVNG